MGADRHQWQFPRNEANKVLGWRADGKGMENKEWVGPGDIAGKQDADSNLDTLSSGTTTLGTTGLAVLEAETKAEARAAIGALSDAAGAVDTANIADGSVTADKLANDINLGTAYTPAEYGAVGDGTTDDAAALNTALSSIPEGSVLDGLGKTYRVDSTLVVNRSFVELRNAVIDFSNAPTGDKLFESTGALGTDRLLTANALSGATSVNVDDASGLAVNDLVEMYSDTLFATNTSVKTSEMVRIKSISGNTITLTAPLSYSYTTGANSKLRKLNFWENIKLRNIRAFGSGAGGSQYGGHFKTVADLTVVDCLFEDFDDRSLMVDRSAVVNITRTRTNRSLKAGLAYGISVVNGSHWVNITECSGERVRHVVAVGGSDGVNRFVKVANCNAFGCGDAGFDCHPAGDFIDFIGNYVVVDLNYGGNMDGIIIQGANAKMIGNTIRGAVRYAVFYQNLTDFGAATCVISENDCEGAAGATYAIFAVASGATLLESLVIKGNTIRNYRGAIRVRADTAIINAYAITGNSFYEPALADLQFIYIESKGTNTCHDGTISGNSGRLSATGTSIYLVADNAGYLRYAAVTGNSIRGGTYGCRGINTDNINVVGNVFSGAGTLVSVAGAGSASANNI